MRNGHGITNEKDSISVSRLPPFSPDRSTVTVDPQEIGPHIPSVRSLIHSFSCVGGHGSLSFITPSLYFFLVSGVLLGETVKVNEKKRKET